MFERRWKLIDIAKKKLPFAVVAVLLYLSYCAMSWYVSRGVLAYYGGQNGLGKWFVNDAWAFFLGGIVPFVLYMVISRFIFRSLVLKTGGGDIRSLKYGLELTLIAVNILLFALKFMYLALPLYATLIDAIIDPVITLGFVGLYLFYAFGRNYVEKSRYRLVVGQVMSAFIAVYGIVAFVNLILALV